MKEKYVIPELCVIVLSNSNMMLQASNQVVDFLGDDADHMSGWKWN